MIDDIFATSIGSPVDSDSESDDLENAFIVEKLGFNLKADELKMLLSELNLLPAPKVKPNATISSVAENVSKDIEMDWDFTSSFNTV